MTDPIVERALRHLAQGADPRTVIETAVRSAEQRAARAGWVTLAEAADQAGVSLRRAQQLAGWLAARGFDGLKRDGRRILADAEFVRLLRQRRRHGVYGTSGPPGEE